MGAGYGNHEDAAKAAADRPGADSAAQHPKPKPGSESGSKQDVPSGSGQDSRDVSTPGAGALPSGSPQGGDVDPGAG